MSFVTTTSADSIVIGVPVRFDFSLMRYFRSTVEEAVHRHPGNEIVVDLAKTNYLDSAALGMLLVLRDHARRGGKSVVLSRATGAVRSSLDVANFGKLFEFR
ncbi:MAG TPA: STAS domain-containing protein [Rhodocyclaceae bacterium]